MFPVSEGAALGIVYSVLGACTVVALLAARLVYQGLQGGGGAAADFWYSARDSQGWISLGLSFFASSMGAWVLFAAPEVGILSGWWGTLGYALASSVPFALFAVLGPLVRERFGDGFCLTDWLRQRFGRTLQLYAAVISIFYMWVYLVAELVSVGNLIRDQSGLDPLHALLPVSLVTMLYTTVAGLPGSIWTDRLQGVIMVVLLVIAMAACLSGLEIGEGKWEQVSLWTDKGFESLVTLVLAILGAELFNMGSWQRVYAAQSSAQLRKGCLFGAALIFPTMILFGVAGMLAEAQDQSRATPRLVIKAIAFFDLLSAQPSGVVAVVFGLGLSMVASSVDTLQTGLISVLSKDILNRQLTPMQSVLVGQVFLVVANVPAIVTASEGTKDPELRFNIINLFLIADLLTLSVVVPVFMGLWPLATQGGALAGCLSGLLFIMAYGWFEFGTFMAGLEMVTLMAFGNVQPAAVGLGASRTCLIFFALPIITGATTYVVSWMDRISQKLMDEKTPLAEGKATSLSTI